jgi:hypothetical protein
VASIGCCALLIGVGVLVATHLQHARLQAQQQAAQERVHSTQEAAVLQSFLQHVDPDTPGGSIHNTPDDLLNMTEQDIQTWLAGDPQRQAAMLLTLSRDKFGRGDYQAAQRLQEQAVGKLMKTSGPTGTETLTARYLLIRTLDVTRQLQAATKLLASAARDAAPLLMRPSQLTLLALWVQAGHAVVLTNAVDAQHLYEEAESVRIQAAPDDPVWRYRIHGGLAWSEVRTGHSPEARRLVEDMSIAEHLRDKLGLYDWIKLEVQYGIALRNLGDLPLAKQILDNATKTSAHDSGPGTMPTAVSFYYLASVYETEGKLRKAAEVYGKSHAALAQAVGEKSSAMLEVRATQAYIELMSSSRHSRHALSGLQAAYGGLRQMLGYGAPATQLARYHYALALCEAGRAPEAEQLAKDLDAASLAAEDASDGWTQRLEALHGQLLIASGHTAEGEVHLQTALHNLRIGGTPGWLVERLGRPMRPFAGASQALMAGAPGPAHKARTAAPAAMGTQDNWNGTMHSTH